MPFSLTGPPRRDAHREAVRAAAQPGEHGLERQVVPMVPADRPAVEIDGGVVAGTFEAHDPPRARGGTRQSEIAPVPTDPGSVELAVGAVPIVREGHGAPALSPLEAELPPSCENAAAGLALANQRSPIRHLGGAGGTAHERNKAREDARAVHILNESGERLRPKLPKRNPRRPKAPRVEGGEILRHCRRTELLVGSLFPSPLSGGRGSKPGCYDSVVATWSCTLVICVSTSRRTDLTWRSASRRLRFTRRVAWVRR